MLLRKAEWVERVNRSPSSALFNRLEATRARGVRVYDLGIGDADFTVAEHIKDAAIAAIRENFNGYTSTAGMLPLRQAIAERLHADIGVDYAPGEIIVTVGAKHAIFNAIVTLCRAGDEVLIPVPYWVSFPEQVKFAGGAPVRVPTESGAGYKLTRELLERYAGPRARILILNSPNNPSGAVYTRGQLEDIAAFCVERGIWVITDEIYAAFTYTPGGHVSIASLPGMRERTVVVSGVSKIYGMTGWRIGYTAAPQAVADAMLTLQTHTTSNPNSIAQRAALAALTGPQEGVATSRTEYARRRLALVERVRRIRGLRCLVPEGTIYLWVDASDWCGRDLGGRHLGTTTDLAEYLMDEARVAVGPGAGFGSDTHIRLCFAMPPEEVAAGMDAIERVLGAATAPPFS